MPKVYLSESERMKARLSTWVTGAMRQKNISQSKLGAEIGVKQQNLSKKLANHTLDYGDFVGIIKVLKPDRETLDWLLGYKE